MGRQCSYTAGSTNSDKHFIRIMAKSHKDKVVHKAMKSIDKFYNEVPAFADIFDEETWYQFCFVFVCCTVVCVFLLSRYINLRSQDPLDKDHRGVKLKKQGCDSQPRQKTQCVYKEE